MKYFIFLIGICCIVSTGCSKYTFESLTDQTYAPQKPCKLQIVVKFKENTENDYLLIGTCVAKAPAGELGNKNLNNAFALLEECACLNGGELIRIIDHNASSSVSAGSVVFSGASALLNKDAPRTVNKDDLLGEIYIKK